MEEKVIAQVLSYKREEEEEIPHLTVGVCGRTTRMIC